MLINIFLNGLNKIANNIEYLTKHDLLPKIFWKTISISLILYCPQLYAIEIYGHRGARGLAPENTISAYKTALKWGVDYIDMDVVMTKDKVVVVQHDLTLNPMITRHKNGKWITQKKIIKNMLFSELQNYDVGRIKPHTPYAKLFASQIPVDKERIPSLQSVIRYAKKIRGSNIGFQIEIKTDPDHPELSSKPQEIAAAVAKIIKEENIEAHTQVQAFDWACLLAIQKINPNIVTAYITDENTQKLMHDPHPKIANKWTGGFLLKNYYHSIPYMIKKLGGQFWDPEDTAITAKQVIEAHRLGLKVIVWSNPEKKGKEVDLKRIAQLKQMQVDGIITDRPDIVKNFLS